MTILRRLLYLCLWLAVLLTPVYAVYSGRVEIPDRWNPWAPLEIDEPFNWLTRFKLARLGTDRVQCLAVLEHSALRFTPVPDRETGPGCELENAVRVTATSVAIDEAFTLSCRSAVALAMWERHVLQPAAQLRLGTSVARLEHFGTYACRNIYARKDAPLSRHATADAIDVAGFVLNDGRRIRVARDWGADDADARFLRDVRDGACRVFDAVLGPDYNAAHRDHFHFRSRRVAYLPLAGRRRSPSASGLAACEQRETYGFPP